jgi:hypothetical protein
VLPDWPPGTVTILSTHGDSPHAIPVSAALRAGPTRALLALAAGRESLARLRVDPRVALTIVAAGDTAVSAHGSARVIDGGVSWRWTDAEAQARDAQVRAALERLLRD